MSDQQTAHFRTLWSEEDREWVGVCDAFPSLSHLAPTKAEALEGIARLVQDVRGGAAQTTEQVVVADTALRLARALKAQWAVGTAGRFMDGPAEWDEATEEEIANTLREGMLRPPTA